MSRILAVAVLGFLCSACSVTRKIPEGQYLLQKVTIESDKSTPRKERITAADLEKYVRQTPNKRFLGTNFYVWLYEQANPGKQNWWNNWKRKIGQEPVLLDMSLTERSAQNLKVYMDTRGFFSSQATFEVDTTSRRRRASRVGRERPSRRAACERLPRHWRRASRTTALPMMSMQVSKGEGSPDRRQAVTMLARLRCSSL